MSFNTTILKKYAQEGYNVLLSGKHGVGKTAIIKEVFGEVFGEHNESWMYFSSSTIDPWVDFIGIPKNYTTSDGKEVFKIIPPERLTGDEKIEAMFFDEINRADEKTLNALMELIQFKSINGRKFPHLKCIWAAENPADDDDNEYSVTELDPAQKDRFQIQLKIPYTLNSSYFMKKYGKETYEISNKWWNNNKNKISPRKLDDMLSGFNKGFSLSDFTHYNKSVGELQFSLNSINDVNKMRSIIETNDEESIKSYFTLDKIRSYEKILKSKKDIISGFYKHVDDEIKDYIERNLDYYEAKPLDMSLFTKEQVEFINKICSNPRVEFNNNYNVHIKNYISKFPFTLKNTPDVDYSDLVDEMFGFFVDVNYLKTYNIDSIVNYVGISNMKKFYEVMFFMLGTLPTRAKPDLKETYRFITKFLRCSRFSIPSNMDKKHTKMLISQLGKEKISKDDIHRIFM